MGKVRARGLALLVHYGAYSFIYSFRESFSQSIIYSFRLLIQRVVGLVVLVLIQLVSHSLTDTLIWPLAQRLGTSVS